MASKEKPGRRRRDRPSRKYGFACANCRKRKARCDGGMPKCGRCTANNEDCHFNKGPSVASAIALQDRISSLEALLDSLRGSNDTERLNILNDHFEQSKDDVRNVIMDGVNNGHQRASSQAERSIEDDRTQLLQETSVDEHGRVCFYGSTSLFHMKPGPDVLLREEALRKSSTSVQSTTSPVSCDSELELQSAPLPQNPTAPLSTHSKIDGEMSYNADYALSVCRELLETYWCWPHHLHLVLCRKLFMRDVANFGPFVTPFLFYAVLAQAARFSDRADARHLSQQYAERTLQFLAIELDKGSSIPAIQGLLIFSARECGCGRTSQGWLYSGIAFRMMKDLGMHIHPRKLSHLVGQFTPEEMALRQQLFWSCYTWDTAMSLCLGRSPSIHDSLPIFSADLLLDSDEADEEIWQPKFANAASVEIDTPQKTSSATRFVAYCSLCIIIKEVLETLYCNGHAKKFQIPEFFENAMQKLDSWKVQLPQNLYTNHDARFISCPPLHILVLNLLYHVTIILLCRPYRSTQDRAQKTATMAAGAIDSLLMLHIRRYGFRVITYLESYTVFVASTINILDMKDGIGEETARARLSLNLEVLRNASSTPSNARCVKIIEQSLLGDAQGRESHSKSINNQPQQNKNSPYPLNSIQGSYAHTQRRDYTQPVHQGLSAMHPEEEMSSNVLDLADYLSSYNQEALTNGNTSQTEIHMDPTLETPLRWLPDNIGDNHEWMMASNELPNDLSDSLFSTWNINIMD